MEKKCLLMCANVFELVGIKDGYRKAKEILDSGKAYNKMIEIIRAQGGKEIAAEDIRIGKFSYDYVSSKKGAVKDIDNLAISRIARIAGAPHDKGAGLYLYKHIGDKVKRREKLFTIYSENEHEFGFAVDFSRKNNAFVVR